MKDKMLTFAICIVFLVVFSIAVLDLNELNADGVCSWSCPVWCYKEDGRCFIAAEICIDDQGGTPYFWFRQHGLTGWTRCDFERSVPCADLDCDSYELHIDPSAICGERYQWRVTIGTDVEKNIVCEDLINGFYCPE